ncbi:MAG: glycosyltransferase [Oscillatoria princeps RMCB-10]|jgi:hypothetical protein|nr:glycosyltransferase [Oscillatoria princeps RMCB-10]
MTEGIYTLANDVVYDQLVALLNSIEANAGKEIPVCVIPYDSRLDKVRAEVAARKNVTLFDDTASIAYWEDFATQAWKTHPRAEKVWQERGMSQAYRLARHRKLCAFDGPFDKFIYFDADTLAIGALDEVYQKLDEYDWVTNDFQYKSDVKYIFEASEEERLKLGSPEEVTSHIFCSGWFASKKGMFNPVKLANLLEKLKAGEANTISLQCIDQPLLNYMVLRSDISYYNFAYHGIDEATGSHWSSKFETVDNVLYDRGRRITYLHYMSVPSSKFTQLCAGEDVDIPYRDVFLHYRYLKLPEERPQLKAPSLFVRLQRSASRFIKQKVANIQHRWRKLTNRLT